MNTEFYPEHEKDQIKLLILFTEHTNCMGKQAFQSTWNIEQTKQSLLEEETLVDVSCNISTREKRKHIIVLKEATHQRTVLVTLTYNGRG